MKRLLCILLIICAGVSRAGQGSIPDGTRWIIRVEWKRLIDGEAGVILKPILEQAEFKAKLSDIEKTFGVNLIKDIQNVTVFGKDASESNVVVAIRGNCDRIKVEGIFRAIPNHKEQTSGARIIHQWDDKGQLRLAAFFDDHLLVFGNAEAPVRQALDALDGKGSPSTIDQNSNTDGALLFCAARDIQNIKPGEVPNAAVLKQLFELSLLVEMSERQVGVKIDAKLGKEDTAKHIKNIAEGLRSLAILNAEIEQPTKIDFPQKMIMDLVQKVQVKAEGEKVGLSVRLPIETVALVVMAVVSKAEIKVGN